MEKEITLFFVLEIKIIILCDNFNILSVYLFNLIFQIRKNETLNQKREAT